MSPTPLEAVRAAIQPLLEKDESLVAAALKKGDGAAVVLVHGEDPERWVVGVYADGLEIQGYVDYFPFGADLDSMQRACSKFIELAAGYVREYPSWYTAPPPYRSVDGGSR